MEALQSPAICAFVPSAEAARVCFPDTLHLLYCHRLLDLQKITHCFNHHLNAAFKLDGPRALQQREVGAGWKAECGGRGNENRSPATDRACSGGIHSRNTDTFSVFVNLCVSVLELLSKRRELAEQVSVWPQRWPLLVTGPAACPE